MLAAGDRACTAASAATLRSTLSGVASVPVPAPPPPPLVASCESFCDLRPSRCRPCLSFCVSRLLARSELRSLPEEAARDSRCSVFWELMLCVRWLLLLLLRLRLLRPPPSPSPSLLMLLQALWPRDKDCASASASFPPDDNDFLLPLSFSSPLHLLYSPSKGGTREPGHCLVERDAGRLI